MTTIESKNKQRETMKVQHHPTEEKKNFKEYFLKFLIIKI
jgi:hypothetical protein